ncbi:hypothetical protein QR680_011391 [Steinernema hermaphroditum]|uniref:Moesin/ezrin/radixin homolog 1 n=1 Tax=Steinernema hermaphroditum TaxID=289476 RepID=A0AA39ITK2_9BILA|nr:hypothetical protein QR680_011391 [Steinernema hermaphroditum]
MTDKQNVRVTAMDAELEFAIQSTTTGKQLYDQVVKTIGLREVWYFGLLYTDSKGYPTWLKLNKKVTSQDVKKEPTLQFKFRAKFYPEDVAEEIIQEITLRLFYLQVKEAILSEEVYCPAETSVLLASYAMQSKYGDFAPDTHKAGCLASDRLLPQRVSGQYKLSTEEWEKRIMVWWADHKAMTRETAMLEYLKLAQDLEMYGVNYFDIKNKKGTELHLGVDALGLNIYEKTDKLSPKVGFPWSEIRNISFNDKKFVIKPIDKKASDFVFYAPRLRINKRILALCMGNHELYMRRRKPDTIEVQQMKQQAEEERQQKRLEQERLSKEMSAREAAEQKQKEYEERMRRMQEDMERAQQELLAAQDTIRRLEQQLADLQMAKQALESKESELLELTRQLQSEKVMSEEERERLVVAISEREQAVAEMRSQVDAKTEETYRLQQEVEMARQRQQAENHARGGVREHEGPDDLTNAHLELTVDEEVNVPQTELERVTATEKNVNIRQKLEMLTKELDMVKDQQQVTDYDVLHMENKRAGRDKYKTLRQIRGGNTKRRIDQYENMCKPAMNKLISALTTDFGVALALQQRAAIHTTAELSRARRQFFNIHKKVSDPERQDPEYFEKQAAKLALDDHYIDALQKLYTEKIGSERDLNVKADDSLVGRTGTPTSSPQDYGLPEVDLKAPRLAYANVDELTNAPESVKRIFSIDHGQRRDLTDAWKQKLIQSVNKHKYDESSLQMRIAWTTALIRHWSILVDEIAKKTPKKPTWLTHRLWLMVDYRRKLLRQLREQDSEAFAEVIKTLKIAFHVPVEQVGPKTRKAWSERQLRIRVDSEKERRLKELHEELKKDRDQKMNALDGKLKKLADEEQAIKNRLETIMELEGKATKNVVGVYQPHLIENLSETTMHATLFGHRKPTLTASHA